MCKKILVFGLSGSGKTTFSKQLIKNTNRNIDHYEADTIRKIYDDWDFTVKGRNRQHERMMHHSNLSLVNKRHAICDYINPIDKNRDFYDIKIFMNTVTKSKYKDTDKIFETPTNVDFEITSFDEELNLFMIKRILNEL